MQEVELDWKQVIAICWLLIWRGALGGALLGFVLGLVVNLISGLAFGVVLGTTANMLAGIAVALLWWPIVVRMALRKKYQTFRIALVAHPA